MTGQYRSCCGGDHCDAESDVATLGGRIRKVAFQHLLQTRQPVFVSMIADELGEPRDRVEAVISALDCQGRIRRTRNGAVVGSAGLSVEPSRHELYFGGRRFWTWCAYDALGILAALRADGRVLSKSPLTGVAIEIRFQHGSPEPKDAVLFLPDFFASRPESTPSLAPDVSVFDDLCPQANLFESRAAASAWTERHRVAGQILWLTEAVALGGKEWQPVVPTSSA